MNAAVQQRLEEETLRRLGLLCETFIFRWGRPRAHSDGDIEFSVARVPDEEGSKVSFLLGIVGSRRLHPQLLRVLQRLDMQIWRRDECIATMQFEPDKHWVRLQLTEEQHGNQDLKLRFVPRTE